MAQVAIRGVRKRFGGTTVIHGVDIDIADGDFAVLVGPSGCGKTTLLRMIAGLEEITEGEILIGGRVVNRMQPKERDIAMVFQNYALYPHMTVRDNMSFSLRLANADKATIAGQLARVPVEQFAETEDVRRTRHLPVDRRLVGVRQSQAERHVVAHGHVRIQRVVLEHHRDVPFLRGHAVDDAFADQDLAFADFLEAGDHAQQGGLAAARGADEHRELAIGDLDIDAVDYGRRAETLGNAAYCDLRHLKLSPRAAGGCRCAFQIAGIFVP